jgi:drug/metabolite transporter (DMT)-like permease
MALRILLAVLGLTLIAIYSRPAFPQTRRLWLVLVVLGITNTALPFVLIAWGQQYIDSAVASILISTAPLVTMILAHQFLQDDRITPVSLVGILVGFLGVIFLLLRDLEVGDGIQINLLGQGAVLLAACLYASSSVFARRNARGLSPIEQSLFPLIVADLLIWITIPFVESPLTLPQLPVTWLAIVWLGLIGSCLAYLLYYYLLGSVGPTRTAMVSYTFPLVGITLGVLFLGERLDWPLAVGGALVLGSVLLVNRERRGMSTG